MSDENKSLVRRFFEEVINAENVDRADEFVTADYAEHQQLPGGEGRQGIRVAKAFLSMMRRAFPDYRFDIEDLVAEGDKVVARVTVSGTHRGEMMGLAPTGRRVRTSGIEVFRLAGGKLAEHWATFDALGMLRQIGMAPVPGPALLARTLVHQTWKRLPLSRASR
ncbi:MAG: ester cyclase [Actinomycetota bacterium]|nr:ester cyclase [Actinomycetota bacterium]